MLREDVEAAIAAVRDGGWGDRHNSLEFYVGHPRTRPLVAESDGTIVGTAVATQNGDVGWVGLVFVAPSWRGRGLGAELTRASLGRLEDVGCRSFVLAATELGRPVYDRLGFRAEGGYAMFSGPAGTDSPHDARLRRLRTEDLESVCALDRVATDEDRSHVIRATADGWVIDAGGIIRGFALRTPWRLGPAIATDASDGALLLETLRAQAPGPEMLVVVPEANATAAEQLRGLGFVEQRRLPRMVLGAPVAWQPDRIWAIFGFAMG
jgi:GNAT superfamily N-acetyltransferase